MALRQIHRERQDPRRILPHRRVAFQRQYASCPKACKTGQLEISDPAFILYYLICYTGEACRVAVELCVVGYDVDALS